MAIIGVWGLANIYAYNFPPSINGEQQGALAAILDLFLPLSGGSMSGNVTFTDVGEGTVSKEGSVSAQGRVGTIAFQSGLLDVVSNANASATTHIFFTQKGIILPATLVQMSATNQNGIGYKMIPSVASTNNYDFVIVNGN